jgi:AbrB family looped-hinge helix DNA binding protein
MTSQVTLDKAGRIVLPKLLRDELGLEAGDTLEVESSSEEITLRPMRGNGQLRKKHGIWVYRSGERLSQADVDKTVREVREERENQILGKRS